MRLADRHILAELLPFFAIATTAVLTLLVGIALLFQQTTWEYLPFSVPYYLSLTLPVSIALAASLAVNRMARDNELTVLRSCGTSLFRAFLPILLVGLIVSVADYILFDRVLPWAIRQERAKMPQTDQTTPGNTFAVDRFTIAYASSVKISETRRRLNKLVLVEFPEDGKSPPKFTTANRAEYEDGRWLLQQVVFITVDTRGITTSEQRVASRTLVLPVDFSNLYRRPDSAQVEYTFSELMHRASEAARFGNQQDAIAYEVDAWTKLALPTMAFVFTLFTTPLSLRFARTGSFSGIMLSIGTVFVAWNTLLFMQYVGYGGFLPPAVAAWATDAFFAVGGLILLRHSE